MTLVSRSVQVLEVDTDRLEPPTRPQTLHDSHMPPQGRPTHPFAYDTGGSLPFAALSGAPSRADPNQQKQTVTRESEVMSRGAGMGGLASLGPVIGDDSGDRSGSVGMGTFGQDMTRGRADVSKVHDQSE
jgi:hypothetical protein